MKYWEDVLPRSDDQDDTQRCTLDVTLETRLIGIGERYIGQAGFCDREKILCAVDEASDFTSTLSNRSE